MAMLKLVFLIIKTFEFRNLTLSFLRCLKPLGANLSLTKVYKKTRYLCYRCEADLNEVLSGVFRILH